MSQVGRDSVELPSVTKSWTDPRIRAPLFMFAALMGIFSVQRLVVLGAMGSRFGDAPAADVAMALLVGLRFDLVIACTLAAPLLVLSLAPRSLLVRPSFQLTLAAGLAAVTGAVIFGAIADYYFFGEFNERLNHKALLYLSHGVTYQLIWDEYPLLAALVTSAGVMGGMLLVLRRAIFPRGFGTAPLSRLVVWTWVAIGLAVVGIRGTLGPKSINSGPAYFGSSTAVSQLALNGLFTLREAAISLAWRDEPLEQFLPTLPEEEALATAAGLVFGSGDRPAGRGDNPLWRITDTGRPQRDLNVVMVVMESLHWPYIGCLGGEPGLTPNLDALAAEGVLMDRCFAVGTRTTRGFSGIISGFPDLPGQSVTTRPEVQGNFLTLGHVLARRGYETMFIYAGQPSYDHRQAFLGSNGFSKMVFAGDFESRTFRTHLGWCDEDLFQEAHRRFVKMGDRPFFATLLTLSFHRPFRIPPGRIEPTDQAHQWAREFDCVRYADWAIGRFIEQARQSEYFDRTIFVFVADHAGGPLNNNDDVTSFRVPFLIYSPSIIGREARRITAVCSQTDVAPTVMELLGGKYEHCFFGSSVLDRPREQGVALLLRTSDSMSLIAGSGEAVTIPFHAAPSLLKYEPPDQLHRVPGGAATEARRQELRRQAIALLQAADTLYRRQSYRPSTPAGDDLVARPVAPWNSDSEGPPGRAR
jgi:hypothetical protein